MTICTHRGRPWPLRRPSWGGRGPYGGGARYDPAASEPELSAALTSFLWDLSLLARHYHPHVASLARHISTIATSPASATPGRPAKGSADPYLKGQPQKQQQQQEAGGSSGALSGATDLLLLAGTVNSGMNSATNSNSVVNSSVSNVPVGIITPSQAYAAYSSAVTESCFRPPVATPLAVKSGAAGAAARRWRKEVVMGRVRRKRGREEGGGGTGGEAGEEEEEQEVGWALGDWARRVRVSCWQQWGAAMKGGVPGRNTKGGKSKRGRKGITKQQPQQQQQQQQQQQESGKRQQRKPVGDVSGMAPKRAKKEAAAA
ncbi:hypothetical protein CLOP_g13231 [Closterium sp. NIES-67]|nr:hypothetical protein CLOP_g13231 [Closterium sp. NIES-67]